MENKLDFGCFFKRSYACILIWMLIHIVLKGMCTQKKIYKGKKEVLFHSLPIGAATSAGLITWIKCSLQRSSAEFTIISSAKINSKQPLHIISIKKG